MSGTICGVSFASAISFDFLFFSTYGLIFVVFVALRKNSRNYSWRVFSNSSLSTETAASLAETAALKKTQSELKLSSPKAIVVVVVVVVVTLTSSSTKAIVAVVTLTSSSTKATVADGPKTAATVSAVPIGTAPLFAGFTCTICVSTLGLGP